jgi:hypothetical protein
MQWEFTAQDMLSSLHRSGFADRQVELEGRALDLLLAGSPSKLKAGVARSTRLQSELWIQAVAVDDTSPGGGG